MGGVMENLINQEEFMRRFEENTKSLDSYCKESTMENVANYLKARDYLFKFEEEIEKRVKEEQDRALQKELNNAREELEEKIYDAFQKTDIHDDELEKLIMLSIKDIFTFFEI